MPDQAERLARIAEVSAQIKELLSNPDEDFCIVLMQKDGEVTLAVTTEVL